MKNLILTVISIVFLFFVLSCSMDQNQVQDWYRLQDNDLSDSLKNLQTNSEKEVFENGKYISIGGYIFDWTINNIHYECYANGFQLARITLQERKGNCANMTLVELALVYKLTGIKGQLVYCATRDGLHYCARIQGKIYDKTVTQIYEVIDFDGIGNYIYTRQ